MIERLGAIRAKPGDLSPLRIDEVLVRKMLVAFLRDEAAKAGFRKAIVNVSGGIDSAAVAHLAAELAQSGVRVQALCPGIVATEFHVAQGASGPLPGAMDPAEVVQASLAGLQSGEVVCAPTVEDAEKLRSVAESGRAFFAGRPSGALASRYRR